MIPFSEPSADRPRRPVLFVNPRSGGGNAARAALAERARERGIEAVVFGADQSLAASVDEAVNGGADALGVAGGDGSLAIVAAAARAHGLPFVCVPAGTRNHFARDLGVDRRDLVGALDGFTDAVERRIDVAEVNGRLFLNNVSLGIYGDAVRQAEYRDAKLRTLLETVGAALGPSGQRADLHLVDELGRDHHHPAIVLVSNNPYALEPALEPPLAPGARSTLESSRLGIIVLDAPGDTARPPARAWTATSLKVDAPASVHAGVDGEAVELAPPLVFAIQPAALRVRIARRDRALRQQPRLAPTPRL